MSEQKEAQPEPQFEGGVELVIAICAPTGADVGSVQLAIEKELAGVGYRTIPVRISSFFDQLPGFEKLATLQDAADRISISMDAGNKLRLAAEDNSACASIVISEIREERKQRQSEDTPLSKTGFIIRSIKRREEVDTLRNIYGSAFILISVYESEIQRIRTLAAEIAKTRQSQSIDDCCDDAKALIVRDRKESAISSGQGLEDAFPLADYFVTLDGGSPDEQISRFVNLLFNHLFITPTRDEALMFQAWSASLRSADLSRQVGAVIADPAGSIVSEGWNDVPRSGGGVDWTDVEGTAHDYRDYMEGDDASASAHKRIIKDTLEALREANWLGSKIRGLSIDDLTDKSLYGPNAPLRKRDISQVLEYGRIVHAEMAAICSAAIQGRSTSTTTLYCTTFPCHVCARHIMAAGITTVLYIEPYPKSKTKELYWRQVKIDGDDSSDVGAVEFRPFIGIAPRRYLTMFRMAHRKDDRGFALPAHSHGPHTKGVVNRLDQALEIAAVSLLQSAMERMEDSNSDSGGTDGHERT